MTEADYTPRIGSELQGVWKGVIHAGARPVKVTLKIAEREAGSFRAEMDRDDWGGERIPAVSMTRDGASVKIGFRVLGSFDGQFDGSAGQLVGHWIGGGQTNPVTLNRVDVQAEKAAKNFTSTDPADLQGHWRGTLSLPNGDLHFVFHIAKLPNGSFSSTLDDPDQGQNNIDCTSTEYKAPHVSIMWNGVRGIFNGSLKDGRLTGTWRQYGQVHPLTLSREKNGRA